MYLPNLQKVFTQYLSNINKSFDCCYKLKICNVTILELKFMYNFEICGICNNNSCEVVLLNDRQKNIQFYYLCQTHKVIIRNILN